MKNYEKIYGTLGELVYAVAMADGEVQEAEILRLKEVIQKHPWARCIQWSFDYEMQKGNDPEEVYKKVVNNCQSFGPLEEYVEFIDLISSVAEASDGIDKEEKQLIGSFSHDLITRFKKDIAKIRQL